MVQAAKIIRTGLATTGLIGACVKKLFLLHIVLSHQAQDIISYIAKLFLWDTETYIIYFSFYSNSSNNNDSKFSDNFLYSSSNNSCANNSLDINSDEKYTLDSLPFSNVSNEELRSEICIDKKAESNKALSDELPFSNINNEELYKVFSDVDTVKKNELDEGLNETNISSAVQQLDEASKNINNSSAVQAEEDNISESDTDTVKNLDINNIEESVSSDTNSTTSGYGSSEGDPFYLERYIRSSGDSVSGNSNTSSSGYGSSEGDPFYLERYIRSSGNRARANFSNSSDTDTSGWAGSTWGLSSQESEYDVASQVSNSWNNSTHVASQVSNSWNNSTLCDSVLDKASIDGTNNRCLKVSSSNPSNDPSNDPSGDPGDTFGGNEGELGKIRLVNPRAKFGGDCKSVDTLKSTTDSTNCAGDPIKVTKDRLGTTEDDKELFKDLEMYKAPEQELIKIFTKKEIKFINDGWNNKTLDKAKFNDLIDKKIQDMDNSTTLLIEEYIQDREDYEELDETETSEVISEFKELLEHDKFKLRYLADELMVELEERKGLSYKTYKEIAKSCDFLPSDTEDEYQINKSADMLYNSIYTQHSAIEKIEIPINNFFFEVWENMPTKNLIAEQGEEHFWLDLFLLLL